MGHETFAPSIDEEPEDEGLSQSVGTISSSEVPALSYQPGTPSGSLAVKAVKHTLSNSLGVPVRSEHLQSASDTASVSSLIARYGFEGAYQELNQLRTEQTDRQKALLRKAAQDAPLSHTETVGLALATLLPILLGAAMKGRKGALAGAVGAGKGGETFFARKDARDKDRKTRLTALAEAAEEDAEFTETRMRKLEESELRIGEADVKRERKRLDEEANLARDTRLIEAKESAKESAKLRFSGAKARASALGRASAEADLMGVPISHLHDLKRKEKFQELEKKAQLEYAGLDRKHFLERRHRRIEALRQERIDRLQVIENFSRMREAILDNIYDPIKNPTGDLKLDELPLDAAIRRLGEMTGFVYDSSETLIKSLKELIVLDTGKRIMRGVMSETDAARIEAIIAGGKVSTVRDMLLLSNYHTAVHIAQFNLEAANNPVPRLKSVMEPGDTSWTQLENGMIVSDNVSEGIYPLFYPEAMTKMINWPRARQPGDDPAESRVAYAYINAQIPKDEANELMDDEQRGTTMVQAYRSEMERIVNAAVDRYAKTRAITPIIVGGLPATHPDQRKHYVEKTQIRFARDKNNPDLIVVLVDGKKDVRLSDIANRRGQ